MHHSKLANLTLLGLIACSSPDSSFKALQPDIAVAPGEIDFGSVVKLYEVTFEVQVLNAGRAPLDITEIALTDEINGEGIFTITGDADELGQNESLTVAVTFAPIEYLDYEANLVIASNDEDQPEITIPVSGRGSVGSTPDIVIDPASVTFEEVVSGETSGSFFTIKNRGDGPLNILDVAHTGPDVFSLVTDPTGVEIASGAEYTVVAQYSPTDGASGHTGGLIITSTDPDEAETEVVFIGGDGGGGYEFPVAVIDCDGIGIVHPPEVIVVDGTDSYDPKDPDGLNPVSYQWTLLSLPDLSRSELENDTDGAFEFVVDVAGYYDLQLIVTDSNGVVSEPATCQVDAVPAEELYVALSWDTGNSDLDLHLVPEGHSYFGCSDCFFGNPSPPTWASYGYGNPVYALDNQTGYGPENINVDGPSDMKYYIRVHYWADHGGGDTKASISIYVHGELLANLTEDMVDNDRWNVGYVSFLGGTGTFVEEGDVSESNKRSTGDCD